MGLSKIFPQCVFRFFAGLMCVVMLTSHATASITHSDNEGGLVLLRDCLPAVDGALEDVEGSAWKAARGTGEIRLRARSAFIPGAALAEAYVVCPIASAMPERSVVEASFTLRLDTRSGVDQAVEPSTGFVFQFASADGRQRRGRLAVRVNADGSCQLGVSAKSSNAITWAEAEVSRFEDHSVVVRYDPTGGRVSLWIDASGPGTKPVAEATDADSFPPAQISLQQAGKPGAPDVRISDIVVRAFPTGGEVESRDSSARKVAAATANAATPAASTEPRVTPQAHGFKVFLLIGQSNMAGRGVVEESDRKGDLRILAQQADGGWVVAREPLHWDKPRVAGVGPGLAFARALLPALPSGTSLGLIPAAFGGTRVAWWQKDYDGPQRWPGGATYFKNAVACARAVPAGSLAGVLWIQGESDGGAAELDGGAAYRRDLHAFIRDLRVELGAPELPFVAATLKPWNTESSRALNAVYLALPREVAHTAVVNTSAPGLAGKLRNKPDDPPHYDSPSARLLGTLFAREMAPLLGVRAP